MASGGGVLARPERVVEFWFGLSMGQRCGKSDEVDQQIRQEFGFTHVQAGQRLLESWKAESNSCLALTIVLDQFSRNLHRDGHAFDNDAYAREIACHALEQGFDKGLPFHKALFFYLPFMHSEGLDDQKRSVELCRAGGDDAKGTLPCAVSHHDIIERFGRYPHRNEALGRQSTEEELEFLKTFGGF